jgi:hypothetical protein
MKSTTTIQRKWIWMEDKKEKKNESIAITKKGTGHGQ